MPEPVYIHVVKDYGLKPWTLLITSEKKSWNSAENVIHLLPVFWIYTVSLPFQAIQKNFWLEITALENKTNYFQKVLWMSKVVVLLRPQIETPAKLRQIWSQKEKGRGIQFYCVYWNLRFWQRSGQNIDDVLWRFDIGNNKP